VRFLPPGLIVHRHCPRAAAGDLETIGRSRDGLLTHLARKETVEAFKRMSGAAKDAGVQLHVIWAFRDPELQKSQFEEAKRKHGPRNGIRWLAPPGFSEHQTGWVLDIGDLEDPEADDNPLFSRTKAFRWLSDNACLYDFELSFPPGNWQGVSYEPWHWRYVGTPAARQAFHPQGLSAFWVWGRSFFEALRWWMHP
jgi:D-alanyl-D-alanine carboxypeptidase